MPVHALNVEPFLRRLCEYMCNEHPQRPWPDSTITVGHVVSRNTTLMAVIWKEVDDNIADNLLDEQGGLDRVVFTFTVLSTVRKHVSRMMQFLCTYTPYNNKVLRGQLPVDNTPVSTPVATLTGYRRDLTPESQQLQLTVTEGPTLTAEPYNLQMTSCVNEGRDIQYNPGLDLWQGECLFISTMVNITEEP